MKIGILSDVHGNLVALEAVLSDMRRHAPDALINLGDCVTGPLWPRETFELLETLSLPTVRGNHDRIIANVASDENRQSVLFTRASLSDSQCGTLGALPHTLPFDDGRVLAVHGTPTDDSQYLLHDEVDGRLAHVTPATLATRLGTTSPPLVLCGHSHAQYATSLPGILLVNPGAVGCPRYADNTHRSRAEAGSPHARYAVATRSRGHWSVEMIVLTYDWDVVAQQARLNGHGDWADGFLG